MVDSRQVIEHDSEAALELLAEAPGARDSGSRVVENVADEVKSGDLAGNGGAVDQERCYDDVGNLVIECIRRTLRFQGN